MTLLARPLRELTVNRFAASDLIPNRVRWRLLRALGLNVEACQIGGGCFFGGRDGISIGPGAVLNRSVFVDGSAGVRIGARCRIGMDVLIITGSHEIAGPEMRAGAAANAPVTVGDGAWLGARVTVLPGVTIGAGAVIAAGAVVTGDCDADTLYAGVPARAVRTLPGR